MINLFPDSTATCRVNIKSVHPLLKVVVEILAALLTAEWLESGMSLDVLFEVFLVLEDFVAFVASEELEILLRVRLIDFPVLFRFRVDATTWETNHYQ